MFLIHDITYSYSNCRIYQSKGVYSTVVIELINVTPTTMPHYYCYQVYVLVTWSAIIKLLYCLCTYVCFTCNHMSTEWGFSQSSLVVSTQRF